MSAPAKLAPQPISPLAAQIAMRARTQQQSSQPSPAQSRPPVSLVQMRPAATPEILPPSQPVIDQDDIAQWDQGLRRAVDGHRSTLVEIAYYGSRIRSANGWEKLGFADENEYRENIGLGESTWKEYLKLGDRLSHLGLSDMMRLTFKSARLLTKVDPKIWPEYAWTEEAALLPAREFAMLVDQRNREAGSSIKQESKGKITLDMPLTKVAGVERRIDTLKRRQKLQTTTATIEYALAAAERERSVNHVMEAIRSDMKQLNRLWEPGTPWAESLKESEEERDVRLTKGARPASLSDAAQLSQRLTRSILKSMREIHEVLPEASQSSAPADPGHSDGVQAAR